VTVKELEVVRISVWVNPGTGQQRTRAWVRDGVDKQDSGVRLALVSSLLDAFNSAIASIVPFVARGHSSTKGEGPD